MDARSPVAGGAGGGVHGPGGGGGVSSGATYYLSILETPSPRGDPVKSCARVGTVYSTSVHGVIIIRIVWGYGMGVLRCVNSEGNLPVVFNFIPYERHCVH